MWPTAACKARPWNAADRKTVVAETGCVVLMRYYGCFRISQAVWEVSDQSRVSQTLWVVWDQSAASQTAWVVSDLSGESPTVWVVSNWSGVWQTVRVFSDLSGMCQTARVVSDWCWVSLPTWTWTIISKSKWSETSLTGPKASGQFGTPQAGPRPTRL